MFSHCSAMTNAQSSPRSSLIRRFALERLKLAAQMLRQRQPIASLRVLFHKTRPCPQALHWDGTGNICGLKERGRGGVREGTQAGDGQTLHCARPQQMGKAKYAAHFLRNQFMKPGTREAKGQIVGRFGMFRRVGDGEPHRNQCSVPGTCLYFSSLSRSHTTLPNLDSRSARTGTWTPHFPEETWTLGTFLYRTFFPLLLFYIFGALIAFLPKHAPPLPPAGSVNWL